MSGVEPEVWMVQWTYDGGVWVDAHADEPRARDQARDRGGECLPMVREASYASSQAEIERLRAALQPFVDILNLSEASAIKDGRNPAAVPDTFDVLAFRDVPGLKLGAFRAARAALSGSKE